MGLWLPTCRRLTFNKRGALTSPQWSSNRTARESGTASTSRTPTRPQRSTARVVKWRGELPQRNTRSPNFPAGDGSVKQGRPAATWPRWPTASPGQRGVSLTTLRTDLWAVFQAAVLGDRHAYLEALTAGLALELVNSHVSPHLLTQVQRCGRRLSTRHAV